MSAAVAILFAMFLAFGTIVAVAVTRMARLGELIAYRPGPRAGVGLLEFALVFVAFLIGQILGAAAAGAIAPSAEISAAAKTDIEPTLGEPLAPPSVDEAEAEPPVDLDRLAPTLAGAAVGSVSATLAFLAFWRFALRRGPRFTDGTAATFFEDVGLGIWVFLMTAVPTYGLQAILMQFFPEKHAILEALDQEVHVGFFAAAAFSSAVAAPIAEEIVFRGFLLSAFAQVRRGLPDSWVRLVTGAPVDLTTPAPEAATGDSSDETPGSTSDNPYEAPFASPAPSQASASDEDGVRYYESPADFRRRGGTIWEAFRRTVANVCSFPVVASSTVFALLHAGQGPAPIPLFFFALMLGYLYRQTGRLTPCVTAHFALNGTTMALAGLSALGRHLE